MQHQPLWTDPGALGAGAGGGGALAYLVKNIYFMPFPPWRKPPFLYLYSSLTTYPYSLLHHLS